VGRNPILLWKLKKWLTDLKPRSRLIDGESQKVLSCEHLLGFYCPVTSGYEVLKMSRRLHAGPQREHLVQASVDAAIDRPRRCPTPNSHGSALKFFEHHRFMQVNGP
jgi:hypothetical protein